MKREQTKTSKLSFDYLLDGLVGNHTMVIIKDDLIMKGQVDGLYVKQKVNLRRFKILYRSHQIKIKVKNSTTRDIPQSGHVGNMLKLAKLGMNSF